MSEPASGPRLRCAGPYVVLAGILVLFFWPVWLRTYTFPIGGGDLWGQLYPVWTYVAHFVRQGTLPLWATHLMAGDPIVAEPQYGLLNPLNWWLYLFSPLPRWTVLAQGVLPLYLAGAGLYTYLRRSSIWRLSTGAALVGATAYMLSDPFITHLGHPQIGQGMAWLPWCLLAVDRVLERRRVLALAALPLALTLLAGHYQTALYTGTAVALYALWRLFSQPAAHRLRTAGTLSLIAVCGSALAMPAVLPSLERYPLIVRSILDVETTAEYAWPLEMIIDLFAPSFHGRGVHGFWAPWPRVEGAYAGAVAIYLAILGLAHDIKRPRSWFFLLQSVLSIGFALGDDGPLFPLLRRIDLVARMGKPGRAIYLLAFAIAVGAAAGVEAIRCRPASKRPAKLYLAWSGLLVLGGLLLWLLAPGLLDDVPADRQAAALQGLRQAAAWAPLTAAAVWAARWSRRMVAAGLLLLLTGELILTGTWVELELPGPTPHDPVVAYLASDPNWFRVDVDFAARGLLSSAVLLSYGFEVPQSTGNPMDLFPYTQFYGAIPYKGAPAYQLLGVKYIVVPKGDPPGGEGIWPVLTDAPLVDVHLNTNGLTRAWLVYDTRPVTDIEGAYDVILNADFKPAEVATVENGPDLNEPGSGTLEVLAYRPNRVDIYVRTSSDALLILSDILYPGWTATVDGTPATIYATDAIFRGIHVPAGEHRVTMRYTPRSFLLGVGLAVAAIIILTTATLLIRRRDMTA